MPSSSTRQYIVVWPASRRPAAPSSLAPSPHRPFYYQMPRFQAHLVHPIRVASQPLWDSRPVASSSSSFVKPSSLQLSASHEAARPALARSGTRGSQPSGRAPIHLPPNHVRLSWRPGSLFSSSLHHTSPRRAWGDHGRTARPRSPGSLEHKPLASAVTAAGSPAQRRARDTKRMERQFVC